MDGMDFLFLIAAIMAGILFGSMALSKYPVVT